MASIYKDIINKQIRQNIPKGMKPEDYFKYINGVSKAKDKIEYMRVNKNTGEKIKKHWNDVNTKRFKYQTSVLELKSEATIRRQYTEDMKKDLFEISQKRKKIVDERDIPDRKHKNSKKDYKEDTTAEKKQRLDKDKKVAKEIKSKNAADNQKARDKIIKEIGEKELTPMQDRILSLDTRFKSLSVMKKAGILVAAGGTLALINKITTPKEEREKKSFVKGTVIGTGAVGIGVVGLSYQADKLGKQKNLISHLKSSSGIDPAISKGINKSEKELYDKIRGKKLSKAVTGNNVQNYTKKALGGAAVFIAATSIMDGAMKKKESHDAEVQNNKDEKKLKQQQQKQAKYRKGRQRSADLELGNTVFEMYNDRIGHYAQGNARFK